MKVIYNIPEVIFEGLYKDLPEGLTAIEIINPEDSWITSIKDCIHDDVLQVKLWDEEEYGDDYHFSYFCGEGEDHNIEQLFNTSDKYQNKIKKWISSEDEIVVLNDFISGKEMLYRFLTNQKENYKVHLINIMDEEVRTNDYSSFIKTIEGADKLKSIAFINLRDMFGEKTRLWFEKNDEQDIVVQLIKEEIVNVLECTLELENVNRDFFLFNNEKRAYLPYELKEDDAYSKEYEEYNKYLFERVAPNKGRETCHRLKDYRQRYRKNNHMPLSNYNCKFSGPCKGVCQHCDHLSETLWAAVNEEFGKDSRFHSNELKTITKWNRGASNGATARINGIIRLREDIDGPGIRTLVLMNDCPLSCKYCFNKEIVNQFPLVRLKDVNSLGILLKKDGIYFEATGGGVTFGGGEPLVSADFIHEFCQKYATWNIAVETSLNVPKEQVEKLVEDIDLWIVDIKDMNPDIYKAYTGNTNANVITNLEYLSKHVDKSKVICRLPLIKNFNTEEDVESSVKILKDMGFENFDRFKYKQI